MSYNWEIGAWYRHESYPNRRIQVVTVNGQHAQGMTYLASTKFGGSNTSQWPIGLDGYDRLLSIKEEN